MKKKFKGIILVIIVITIFISLGFIIIKRYDNKESNEIINNYYTVEYLFNNGYIEKPNDITLINQKSNNIYAYLDKDNILYIKDISNNYNNNVNGLPKESIEVYYNKITEKTYELIAKQDSKLYYTVIDLSKKETHNFEKISNNITEIYSIENNNLSSNFLIQTTDSKLKTIILNNNNYTLSEDIEKVYPYFDYICFNQNEKECNNTKIYITFDKKLVVNNKYLIDKKNKEIIIKDIFGVVNKKDNKNYEYKYFITDTNDNIYILENNVLEYYNEKKVVTINYNNDEINKEIYLIYKDGSSEKITTEYVAMSTLYKNGK